MRIKTRTTITDKEHMVSVVIPLYNASETILKSVESVLYQSYEGPLEIIVVNDGSTDNSLDIISQYAASSKANITIIDKKNGGASSARNAGMKEAKGHYIALLDADDIWEKHKLKEQVTILEANPGIDFLGCNRNGEVFSSFFSKRFERLTAISARMLLLKNFFSTPTVIFKKEILNSIGYFNEHQRFAEEGDYFIRICNKNTCMLLNESYVITGSGKPDYGHSGLSSNLLEMEKGELKNLRQALKLNIINYAEFVGLWFYSVVKYARRVLIVSLR